LWRVQYGPIFVETQIDPAKGGKVEATRMGRSYELVVLSPPATQQTQRAAAPAHLHWACGLTRRSAPSPRASA
jgi:hypothetical protein